MFSIHSISSSRQLIFSPYGKRGLYLAEVKSGEISARTFFDYDPSDLGMDTLNDFFQELARFKSPWQGTMEWSETTYNRFEISATCTVRGHVIFWVKLNDYDFSDTERWEAQFGLETTLGELDTIAQNAHKFFNGEVP